MTGLLLFICALVMLLLGFPVAFTFGATALIFALLTDNLHLFSMMPYRVYALMENITLMAVPLFIYMGMVLQRSGLAERLLESMGALFGQIRGGIAVSTVIVGAILAASTGVVGASVVAMAIIALPVMIKYKYSKELSAGAICASGTLGQLIPPSIVLIILGEVLQVSVGDLFRAAAIPGVILTTAYIAYILLRAYLNKNTAPALPPTSRTKKEELLTAARAIVPPLALIFLVLGSIFAGVATPTESAAVGCVGSLVLAGIYGRFSFKLAYDAALRTVRVTSMVFMIFIGATAFSMVFAYTGGEEAINGFLLNLPGGMWGFLAFSMAVIFVLGFFIDFLEITYIIVPTLFPIAMQYDINLLWFGILIAMNLQTSFLTPPFGFSLFYLKGVASNVLTTYDIYKGVIPFIIIQIAILLALLLYPELFALERFTGGAH